MPDVATTHPHIRYRSYAATGRHTVPATSPIFLLTHKYIRFETGQENDGLVTLKSAQYGEFQQPIWAGDHADIVGHNLDIPPRGKSKFDHLAEIDTIIARFRRAPVGEGASERSAPAPHTAGTRTLMPPYRGAGRGNRPERRVASATHPRKPLRNHTVLMPDHRNSSVPP